MVQESNTVSNLFYDILYSQIKVSRLQYVLVRVRDNVSEMLIILSNSHYYFNRSLPVVDVVFCCVQVKESALARQSLYVKFDPLVKGGSPGEQTSSDGVLKAGQF
jgi:hypothetical protein